MSSPTISRRRPAPSALHPVASSDSARTLAPTPATSRLAGRYRYDLHTGAWWWSPEMFGVLDLHPDVATASTDVLVTRVHAEDGPRVLEALDAARSGRSFALEVRTCRSDGAQRFVVLLGEPQAGADGELAAVEGICVDVTDGRPPAAEEDRVRALQAEVLQLRTAMASRACIEQAKGILMLLTNCSDQGAFDLLAHMSSHTHRKVRDVAMSITESATGRSRLPDDVAAIVRDACPPSHHAG